MSADSTVMIVEDDSDLRESLRFLLEAQGYGVEAYAVPSELVRSYDPEKPGCLILDLQLPEKSGLDLQRELRGLGGHHPFLVITGHGDVPVAVKAMRDGAVDFIQKPFDRQLLLERVDDAIRCDDESRKKRAEYLGVETKIDSLTPREQEVMELVVDGKLTKQIASQLQISTKTVEVHRSNITKKMGTESVAQLVRLVSRFRNSRNEGLSP